MLCDSVYKKIRGTPRSAELNRKYQEKYPYLEIFKVNLFSIKLFFGQHKIIFISNATLFFYCNHLKKSSI